MSDAIYPVPAEWAENALIDAARYQAMYARSLAEPEAFWHDEAQRIDWIKPFTTVKNASFHEADFGIKWFEDGTLNLAANCLDRHLAERGDAVAILWEPDSPDEAVFLPGRNALLLVKAAVWCQLNGIRQLLMAPLGTSPFEDAGPVFLAEFQAAMNRGSQQSLELKMPFAKLTKQQVMQRGKGLPLELTFSCISPVNNRHCGVCNKCAERKSAFATAGLVDRTRYALGQGARQP